MHSDLNLESYVEKNILKNPTPWRLLRTYLIGSIFFSPENLFGLQFKPNQFPAFCKSYHQSYIKLYQTSPLEMARDWYFLGSLKLNVDYINSNLYKLGCAYGMSEVAIFNVCHLLTIKLFLFFVFNSLSNDFYILMSFLLFNNRIEQIYIPHMS